MKLKFGNSRRQGSVLMVTLFIMLVVGFTLFAYFNWSQTQTSLVMRSQVWNSALPVAEAGIEEAMAHLNSTTNRGSDGWTLTGGLYTKERTLGDGYFIAQINTNSAPTITSSGFVRVPPGTNNVSRAIQITCSKRGGGGTILAKAGVVFSGGSIVDSFDSSVGPYTVATRKDGAVVMSNGSAVDVVHIGTAWVYGKADTGPGGTVTVDSSGSLGDLAWHAASNTGIEPGTASADVSTSFPTNGPPTGSFFAPASGIVGGTNYTYLLSTGSYQTTTFTVGGGNKALVTGNAVLYCTSGFTISGSGYMWIAPGASLTIYVNGTFTVSGSGIANGTGLAANLTLLGLNGCTTCTYSGSSAFVGVIDTPMANVTVSGSAGFYGAIIGNTVTISGGAGVHSDEALSGNGRYVVDSWNEWNWTEL